MKKGISFMLVIIIAISSIFCAKQNVKANIAIERLGSVTYGASTVGHFRVNGQTAFCIEHEKASPPTGTSFREEIYNNSDVKKALYYGWGGTEQWGGFESEAHGIVATSLTVSHYYAGTNIKSANQSFYDFLQTMPNAPTTDINLSKSELKSYVDGNSQRTQDITLGGDSRNTVVFPLPSGVKLHNVSSGNVGTGNVEVRCGETFYLSAPLSLNNTWESGILKGSMKEYLPVLKITEDPNTQNLVGMGALDPASSINLKVTWEAVGTGKLIKTDVETGKNLSGAVFGIYTDSACTARVDKITTDSKGSAQTKELTAGTYYAKEITAPDDYEKSTKVYTVKIKAGETTSFEATNRKKDGYGALVKKDDATGRVLKGAVYGIYTDSACTDKVDEMTTNADGYAKSGALRPGTYYVKEIKAPKNYVISTKISKVTVIPDEITEIEVTDKAQKGELTICKEGETLTGWNGSNFTYNATRLPGVTFKITAGGNIYRADGTKVYSTGDTIKSSVVTGADGTVTVSDLNFGTYIIAETKTIDGFVINQNPVTVTLSYGNQTETVVSKSATVTNARQKAKVTAVKQDSKTSTRLAGGQYSLYAAADIRNYAGNIVVRKDTLLQTVTTGADGTAAYTVDLPIKNSYYIKETKAPDGYIRNTAAIYNFTFNDLADTVATASFSYAFQNDFVTGKINLIKTDAETGETPQGDATLQGAVYGLYAREDITHPDKRTGVIYAKDTLVAKLTTDAQGRAEKSGLYLGSYYLKELTASNGYLVDPTIHNIDLTYAGDTVQVVTKQVNSKEQIKKQAFSLIKVEDAGESELPVLEKAGFTAYLKSGLKKNADGTYNYTGATPVILTKDGKTELFTDSRGYAESRPLPYGEYVVTESTIPPNHEPIKDFTVKITENSTTPQPWRVFSDKAFMAKLKIVKQDAENGNTILKPNAEFRIFNKDTGTYVVQYTTYPSKVEHTSFKTDESGTLTLPERLKYGHYRVEEIHAPDGYVVNPQTVDIDIDENHAYITDPDTGDVIITVEFENHPVTGEITLEKKGEVPTAYKGGFFARSEKKKFIWEETSLAGAEFEVRAGTDIYTPDNQKDEAGERLKLYTKGDLVETMITGEDGKATLSALPLGTYEIIETKAPEGFVLNPESHFVTLTYEDESTPVIYEYIALGNERQKVELSILKQDEETNLPIAGAEFGLYTAEDIADSEGEVLVEKDTLLETVTSGTDGNVLFEKDLPFGKYYAKEMKAPDGYVSTDEKIPFDFSYQGQNVETVKLNAVCQNKATITEFMKTDITNGTELSGATLTVLDKDGTVMETWTSDAEEPHRMAGLTAGETYTLKEEYAPYGYLKAQEIQFTVEDTGDIQKVNMEDAIPTGTIVINKDGELLDSIEQAKSKWYDFIFRFLKKSLAGVTFEVYAAEDVISPDGLDTISYRKDELVGEIITNDRGVGSMTDLPLGKYYLVETKTLDGFILDKTPIPADLTYIDQNTEIVYAGMHVTNERQKVQIEVVKQDAETKKGLEGAVFGLYAKEDITDSNDKTLVKKDTLIEKTVSGEEGTCVFTSDLTKGTYVVKEIEPPKGYASTDFTYEFTHDGKDHESAVAVYKAKFENEPIRVQITKTDITGEREVPGAKLSVIDSKGKVVESWISTTKPHKIDKLQTETYILREESAPLGFAVRKDITFTVKDTGKIQKVTMKDTTTKGRVVIQKTDEKTGKALAGAEFELRDENGKVLEIMVTDTEGKAESKTYPVGIYQKQEYIRPLCYTLVETKAPEGYLLDVREIEIQFPADTGKNVVTVKKDIANKPTEEKLPQTGEFPVWLAFTGAGITLSSSAVGLWHKNKKKQRKQGGKKK